MKHGVFDSFEEVKDWIQDNKLLRYVFRTGRGETRENNYVFCYDQDATPEENLRILEKRLNAHAGQKLYGTGFRTTSSTGGIVCDVQYGQEENELERFKRMFQGVGQPMQPVVNEADIERRLTEKLTMQFRLEQMEADRKNFEKEKKEFEAEKAGVIGALINYFGPVAQTFMRQKGLAKVAGTDVEAEKIVPVQGDDAQGDEVTVDDLPEEEAEKAYELLKRFRKVEPNYLTLLESVVKMAESGDSNYNLARGFLIKE